MSESTRIAIYVQPRASKTEVSGMHGDSIKIRLAAPPVDGAANAALMSFIADMLGIAKSRVRIVSGSTGRRKVIEIDGVGRQSVNTALGLEQR